MAIFEIKIQVMKRIAIITAILFGLQMAAGSQTFVNYTKSSSGLASNTVRAIAQGASGNMWFATTSKGVSRLSGSTWTTYNMSNGLVDSNIACLASTPFMTTASYDPMWFGNNYNPQSATNGTGVCKHINMGTPTFTIYKNPAVTNFDTYNKVNCIFSYDSKGQVWFGTRSGIYIWTKSTGLWTKLSSYAGGYVTKIMLDASGNVWVSSTSSSGIGKYNGTAWTYYNTFNNPVMTSNQIFSECQDASGNMWFASNVGLLKFDGTTWNLYDPSNSAVPGNYYNHRLYCDISGNIWMSYGFTGYGVSKFDGTTWTTYTTADGLADDYVYDITQDASGNMWFATDGGVSKLLATATDVTETIKTVHAKVYPNPTSGVFEIQVDKNAEYVIVMNMTGQIVFRAQTNGKSTMKIDGSEWNAKGMYVIKVTDKNDDVIAREKIILK